MSKVLKEKVIDVHHWTDTLFTFKTTRSESFRFRSGEFTMIGLEQDDGKPLMRAYSVTSAHYDEHLEFYSIKVPNGPLTSQLQHVKVGDEILIRSKTSGTLVPDYLHSGKRLYMLSTGTGLAPFLSLIKDPEIYEKFDQVILTHGVRWKRELAYEELIQQELPNHEFIGEMVSEQLIYYPTVTREDFKNQGRLTDLITSGKLTKDLGLPDINPEHDRFMICGSPGMLKDSVKILEDMGFTEGVDGVVGHYAIERAFTEKG